MDNVLAYFIPRHGRPKISLGIPESYRLNVCPAACGRRIGIRGLKNGEAEWQSFFYITEAEVMSEDYENILGDAVEELLKVLWPAPRAFVIYVNCMDDFLGKDEEELRRCLQRRFPTFRFVICHINPFAESNQALYGARLQDRLYGLLEPGPKEDSINLIGNFVSPDPAGELYPILKQMGISNVRELHALKTYEEFERMAGARLNLVLMGMGRFAAQNMEKKLGIPWLEIPVSYSMEQVVRDYQKIAEKLDCSLPELEPWLQGAKAAVDLALERVGDTPLILDSSASVRPFTLARDLAKYGFRVEAVFIAHEKEDDRKEEERFRADSPRTRIIHGGRCDTTWRELPKDGIAIGFDSAYIMRCPHFVDVQRDETMFGFHGIAKLMKLMIAASCMETRWD